MPRRRLHHNVYVIELAPEVWAKSYRYRQANLDRDPDKPCLYVGMTGLTPEERFRRHQADIQANPFARDYGVRLRPDLYEGVNPMTYAAAQKMETTLAKILREDGYGVWQH